MSHPPPFHVSSLSSTTKALQTFPQSNPPFIDKSMVLSFPEFNQTVVLSERGAEIMNKLQDIKNFISNISSNEEMVNHKLTYELSNDDSHIKIAEKSVGKNQLVRNEYSTKKKNVSTSITKEQQNLLQSINKIEPLFKLLILNSACSKVVDDRLKENNYNSQMKTKNAIERKAEYVETMELIEAKEQNEKEKNKFLKEQAKKKMNNKRKFIDEEILPQSYHSEVEVSIIQASRLKIKSDEIYEPLRFRPRLESSEFDETLLQFEKLYICK